MRTPHHGRVKPNGKLNCFASRRRFRACTPHDVTQAPHVVMGRSWCGMKLKRRTSEGPVAFSALRQTLRAGCDLDVCATPRARQHCCHAQPLPSPRREKYGRRAERMVQVFCAYRYKRKSV
eukprot:4875294-Prymnesium_polylepis.3